MVVGLQSNISEAVLNFDAQLRKEMDVVMLEVDRKLQEQFATMSQIVAALGESHFSLQHSPFLNPMLSAASRPTSAR